MDTMAPPINRRRIPWLQHGYWLEPEDLLHLLRVRGEADAKHKREFLGLWAAGPCAVFVTDAGELAVIGGVVPITETVAQTWTLWHPEVARLRGGITRDCRAFIRAIGHNRAFWRVQAIVPVSEGEAAERWMKALGFVREGLLHRMTPDHQDAWMYAYYPTED